MHNFHPGRAVAASLAALALAACGSTGIDDILGGTGGAPASTIDEVRGTVSAVDTTGDCRIEVEDTRITERSLRDDDLGGYRTGDRLTLYCDEGTVVVHEGRSYRPAALERGDEIAARVETSGGRLVVDRIDVLRDVTPGDDRASGLESDLRGTVRFVDRERKTIQLERVDVFDRDLEVYADDRVTLYYDTDTDVVFEGRRYAAENLEPGDVIEAEVYELRGQLIVEAIEVVDDVRASRD